MSFIEMKEIEKSFDGLPVLKKVSLAMDKGEVVAIIGPSGSGKSTFLRCLGQLEVIDRGTIVVDGTPLVQTEGDGNAVYTDKKTQQALLLKMGMVFQQFNLFPHMTVWDNILIAPQMVKGMKAADIAPTAEALLKKVGLWEKKDVYPSKLSGGQKQRVAIARALINEPKILLADEPTGNLDSNNAWEIMKLLDEINKRGTTVLVVSHNMEIVEAMKKRVITLQQGHVVSDVKMGGDEDEN